jgi:hypothetical protein
LQHSNRVATDATPIGTDKIRSSNPESVFIGASSVAESISLSKSRLGECPRGAVLPSDESGECPPGLAMVKDEFGECPRVLSIP